MLVTIESAKGSAPRPAGTRMLVTRDDVIGTIGGGHLEYSAIDIARRQLGGTEVQTMRRFPLGASLGQCCGGVVNLTFEPVSPDSALADQVERYFRDAVSAPDFSIVVFGAGHVGRSLAVMLGEIPCRVTWVDTRDDAFPSGLSDNIDAIVTDAPEVEVDAAPSASYFLVMTHSHALDETLTERILRRGDFAYFGLIGSLSKRRQFERRLTARGIDPALFARLTCPIGIDRIPGKEPGVIAIAVVAELLRTKAELAMRSERTDTTPQAPAARASGARAAS